MRSLFLVVALVSMSLVSEVYAAPCSRAVFIGEVVKVEPYDTDFSGPVGIA